MSQRNVERVIGRLATDEGFRRRFAADPRSVLAELVSQGAELNPCELRALASIDRGVADLFADSLDPCIQKIDPHGG
jgi:hypothetical protein